MALVQRSGHSGISAAVLFILCGCVDVVVVQDFRVPALVSIWVPRNAGEELTS